MNKETFDEFLLTYIVFTSIIALISALGGYIVILQFDTFMKGVFLLVLLVNQLKEVF